MTSIDEFLRNHVPSIGYEIPPDEREAVWAIEGLLQQLESFAEDFRAALELFDFCEANPDNTPRGWRWVAARDGAMTLNNFRITIHAITHSFGDAPSLQKQVDHKTLRRAQKLFQARFPKSRSMRNAVGHAAKAVAEAPDEHGRKKPITILHSLQGRRYITERRGETLSYELSAESLEKLKDVKTTVFRSFDRVNIFVRKTPSGSDCSESPQ